MLICTIIKLFGVITCNSNITNSTYIINLIKHCEEKNIIYFQRLLIDLFSLNHPGKLFFKFFQRK